MTDKLSDTIHILNQNMCHACEQNHMNKAIIQSFSQVMNALEEGLRYHHGDIRLKDLSGITQHHVGNGLTALHFHLEEETSC